MSKEIKRFDFKKPPRKPDFQKISRLFAEAETAAVRLWEAE